MSKKSAKSLAKELLEGDHGGLEESRIHKFAEFLPNPLALKTG
jgi:hypothetical protein